MTFKPASISGERFSRLTAIEPTADRYRGHVVWRCRCDCGNEARVAAAVLRAGHAKSCGCLRADRAKEQAQKNTGSTRGSRHWLHPLYSIWTGMKRRCSDAGRDEFARYGGRGIKVCDRWLHGEDGEHPFLCFLADMGERPVGNYSIDRIDPDGDYEPGNCRWATASEQARNRRRTIEQVAA